MAYWMALEAPQDSQNSTQGEAMHLAQTPGMALSQGCCTEVSVALLELLALESLPAPKKPVHPRDRVSWVLTGCAFRNLKTVL